MRRIMEYIAVFKQIIYNKKKDNESKKKKREITDNIMMITKKIVN